MIVFANTTYLMCFIPIDLLIVTTDYFVYIVEIDGSRPSDRSPGGAYSF